LSDRLANLRFAVEPLANYLHNPLPPGPDVCRTCRSAVEDSWPTCYPCKQHLDASDGLAADAVVPIAYAIDGEQHYDDLKSYKATQPAANALLARARAARFDTRHCALCQNSPT
jgi:hypothetical protein